MGFALAKVKSTFGVRMGKKMLPRINRLIADRSLISNAPVLSADLFPWMARIEAEWQTIRTEMEGVLRHQQAVPPLAAISPDHGRIAKDGKWRSFFLFGYGYRLDANCARAPRTAALVAGIPGLNSAFFSILAPGAHIPRHTGVTKAIITCHLGLKVPARAQDCRMDVVGHVVHWEEGKCLVFDDSQNHEVWNDTDETRVVLLLQFRRPARGLGRLIGGLFLGGIRRTSFVQQARRNLGQWEEAYRAAEQGLA